MIKTILLIIVLLLVYWVFWGRRKGGAVSANQTATDIEKMVTCAHCRLHVPEGESIVAAGRHYCCDEHRQLGAP